MRNLRTLVLNADMSPITLFPLHTIPAADAVTRVINGTCEVVAQYEYPILTNRPENLVQWNLQYWPSIIMRRDYVYRNMKAILNDESLLYRDYASCSYCGIELTVNTLTYEHVIPQSAGGKSTWDNILAACSDCNQAKGSSPPVGKWTPKRKPWVPSYWQLLDIRRQFPILIDHNSWADFLGDWKGDIRVRNDFAYL